MIKQIVFFFSIASVWACDSGQPSTEGAAPVQEISATEQVDQGKEAAALPQTKPDTLMIEGMGEPVNLQLYTSPRNWPLQFHTYLPPEITAQTLSSGEGDAVRFSLGEATLSFLVLPEGTNRSEAQSLARAALGEENVQSCEPVYAWQWECLYASETGAAVKRVLIGEQQGRQFYFLISYPAEYGDGFSPRYALILDHFRFGS